MIIVTRDSSGFRTECTVCGFWQHGPVGPDELSCGCYHRDFIEAAKAVDEAYERNR